MNSNLADIPSPLTGEGGDGGEGLEPSTPTLPLPGGGNFSIYLKEPPASVAAGTAVIYRMAVLTLLTLLAIPPSVYAERCRVERNQNQIKVESCALSGTDFRLVRAETKLKGRPAAAIKLLLDEAACPTWRHRCISQTQLKRTGEFETLAQIVFDAGFWGTDRIAAVRLKWGLSPAEDAVIVTVVGDDVQAVKPSRLVRVRCVREQWVLRQAPGDTMDVTYEVVSDPEAWASFVNRETVTTVYETLRKMKRVVQEPGYSKAISLPRDMPRIQKIDVGKSFSRCVRR